MNRKHFLEIAGGTVLAAGGLGYSLSDKSNFVRSDRIVDPSAQSPLTPDEREILYLASLAPSGHNTQPWFVNYVANRITGLLGTTHANGCRQLTPPSAKQCFPLAHFSRT